MVTSLENRTAYSFELIADPGALTVEKLSSIGPRFVFFPHWSHRIEASIYDRFECVMFHMTDLPFGRGGSPLQNLIVRGVRQTKICALRCVAELDAGPVYLRRPLSLQGTAQEIYVAASAIIEDMIVEIIQHRPQAIPQTGSPTMFKRRTPQEGSIAPLRKLEEAYDYIRMLDAPGYPPAFLETEALRLEFSRAKLSGDRIMADVTIKLKSDDK